MMDMMIDIETLSDSRIGAPWWIGWATFDPNGRGIDKRGTIRVDAQDFLDAGMIANWETIQWWLTQPAEARSPAMDGEVSAHRGLVTLREIYQTLSADKPIWAYPADFDLAIMAEAYRRFGMTTPWHRRSTRCSKSVFLASGLDYDKTKEELRSETSGLIKHRPDHDCTRQVLFLQRAIAEKPE